MNNMMPFQTQHKSCQFSPSGSEMACSSKQNKNDSGLEWEEADPCVGLRGGHEPVFYPSYYVQSLSHSQEASENKLLKCGQSPTASPHRSDDDNNAYALCVNSCGSRASYSCSRNSFYLQGGKRARMGNEEEEESVWCGYYYVPTSWMCLCLQLILWSLVTMGVFIVLFSIATRPRSPALSVKKIACRNFGVGEGSDKSGVPTKVVSCSCNVSLDLDNPSQFFGVHARPAHVTMAFADLTVAAGHGREEYVERESRRGMEVEVRARRRAVYGAGPTMARLLHSAEGLPLLLRVTMDSTIRLLWDIVRPSYSHHVLCHLLLHPHLNLSHSHCFS